MAATRRRCLFLPRPVARKTENATGARPVSAPRRYGSRDAAGKSGAFAVAESHTRRCRDDLQQPRSRRLRALPLRAALDSAFKRSGYRFRVAIKFTQIA